MTESTPRHLVAVDDVQTIPNLDGKAVAAVVRRHFRRQHPGVTVSVTSAQQTIRIAWTDGPSASAIEAEYAWVRGKGFDGMTDTTTYRGPIAYAELGDEQLRAELRKLTGSVPMFTTHNWFGTARTYSRAAWDLVAAEIKRQHGIVIDRTPNGAIADTVNGRYPIAEAVLRKDSQWFGRSTDYFSNVARTWLAHTDIPATQS